MELSQSKSCTIPILNRYYLVAGIDLGTTNSLIATVHNGKVEILADSTGSELLPSVVNYQPTSVIVGNHAKIKSEQDPINTIISIKRLLGLSLNEIQQRYPHLPYKFTATKNGLPIIHTSIGRVNPIQVSSEILKLLAQRAEKNLNSKLEGVVITVPAYFDDAQRQATKDAARLAGLQVLRLLNEPTAAALAYGLDLQQDSVIVVYDLGGGTFDISVLRFQHGIFEVLSTGGDTALGGDDFDCLLADWMYKQAGIIDDKNHYLYRKILNIAIQAKISLTYSDCTKIKINNWQGILSRNQLNKLIKPLIQRTLMIARRVLKDAIISSNDISHVVMVGGSTKVPLVLNMVKDFFGIKPLISIDPDKVVAIGAAIQADSLVGNRVKNKILLLDVTPLSLGLETIGGLVEKVIPRNTTLPTSKIQEFTTFKDGQTAISFHVVQGEREMVVNCRSLARFTLRGIPSLPAGSVRVKVIFQIDADGILNVSAVEESTGVNASIQVKPSYGLTDNEVAGMIADSVVNAKNDMIERRLAEKKIIAKQLIEKLMIILKENSHSLNKEEKIAIDNAITKLVNCLQGNCLISIENAIKQLDKQAYNFVIRTINKFLLGRSVDEI